MRALLGLALLLSACGDDGGSNGPSPRPQVGTVWQIGPVIERRNYSVGLPASVTVPPPLSFGISPTQQPHYVTYRHGSLRGATAIRMRYRVEAEPGVIIHGAGCAVTSQSRVTLYFQRSGDSWTSDGWRWWATPVSQRLAGPGEYEITARLDGRWTSVDKMASDTAPEAFVAAVQDADRVGFTFANCEGYGHGAAATGQAAFTVTEFTVQ
jgi:hypothetical protein